jgi:histidyl-tRNA synthetase
MIFEIIIPAYSPTLSCGGGGRYDKLINKLGGPNIPAVGVALGFDRLVEAADFLISYLPKPKAPRF